MNRENLRVPFNNHGSMCDDSEDDEDDGGSRNRGRKRRCKGKGGKNVPCSVINKKKLINLSSIMYSC